MKLHLIASVATLGLALATTTAFAQSIGGPNAPGDQQKLMNAPGYHTGTGGAGVGGENSPNDQQKLLNAPGYHAGTGSSQKNDSR